LSPNSKKVGQILLSGGGSNLKGLANFLSSELKIPVELANPWVNILPKKIDKMPKSLLENPLSFTTALGLALRGVKYN
jgi:Tfp pilus assembly PilM family ATPase